MSSNELDNGTYIVAIQDGEIVRSNPVKKYQEVDTLTIYKLVEVIDSMKDELRLLRGFGLIDETKE